MSSPIRLPDHACWSSAAPVGDRCSGGLPPQHVIRVGDRQIVQTCRDIALDARARWAGWAGPILAQQLVLGLAADAATTATSPVRSWQEIVLSQARDTVTCACLLLASRVPKEVQGGS